jgi:antitoxin Phd
MFVSIGVRMHITATDLKNRLGQYLEVAIREPVVVEKSGRPTSVVISYDEYQRFLALEDELWATKALEAEKEGYLGVKESAEFMRELQGKILHGAKNTRPDESDD